MTEDEKTALKEWKEYHAAIKKYKLDEPNVNRPIVEHVYDGYFAGFYAGRDHEKSKYPLEVSDKAAFDANKMAESAASKVLRGKGRSKAAKTARGSALTQRSKA